LNCFGMTPHELEFALILEILAEVEDGKNNCNGGHEGHEVGKQEHEELREGKVEVVKRE
jgi:hypothetical protein